MLCGTCQGVNFGIYMFCQFCRAPAYRGPSVPRTTAVMIDSKLNERIREVRAALAGTPGQQRKSRVADNFDGFVRARTSNVRGSDVDVF